MAYKANTWRSGDRITSTKLNALEKGVENAFSGIDFISGGDGDRFLADDGNYKPMIVETSISSETGNTLEEREDGLYAGGVEISQEEGNKIVMKPDGVFNDTEGEKGERGESAYEVAVRNGFEGTELEWLASLQGADGKGGTFELVLMNEQHSWTVQSDDEGLVKWVHIGEDIVLNESIKDFDIVQFVIDPADVASGIQVVDFEVHDIVYNPTETFQTGGSRLDIIGTWVKGDGVNHSYGAYHTTMRGWFKNDTTFYVDAIGAPTTDAHDFRLNEIIGIDHLTEKSHEIDMVMSDTSENAIANRVVKEYIDEGGAPVELTEEHKTRYTYFGEPVFERTLWIKGKSLAKSTETILLTDTSIKFILDFKGVYLTTTANLWNELGAAGNWYMRFHTDTGKVGIYNTSTSTYSKDLCATFRYTKK